MGEFGCRPPTFAEEFVCFTILRHRISCARAASAWYSIPLAPAPYGLNERRCAPAGSSGRCAPRAFRLATGILVQTNKSRFFFRSWPRRALLGFQAARQVLEARAVSAEAIQLV